MAVLLDLTHQPGARSGRGRILYGTEDFDRLEADVKIPLKPSSEMQAFFPAMPRRFRSPHLPRSDRVSRTPVNTSTPQRATTGVIPKRE